MKKVVIILLTLFCVNSIYAQWSVTPEAGMAAVKRVGTDDWSARLRAGVGVDYDFSELFTLKSGLYYANRGFSRNRIYLLSEGGEETEARSVFSQIRPNSSYLQLPVLAKFNWDISDDVRFNVAIGPYLGYEIYRGGNEFIYSSYYGDYGYGGYVSYGGYGYLSHDLPDYDGYKFDWGANLAVGLEVKNWVMNLTYESELGKKYKYDEVKTKYHTFSLTLGYKFRL